MHIHLSQHETASTPFIQQQANVVGYAYDMWISSVENEDGEEETILQYGQSSGFEFMTRLECLECQGVTSTDANGCITSCAGMDDYIYKGVNIQTGEPMTEQEWKKSWGDEEGQGEFVGSNFNQMLGFLHGQCYSCRYDMITRVTSSSSIFTWHQLKLLVFPSFFRSLPVHRPHPKRDLLRE